MPCTTTTSASSAASTHAAPDVLDALLARRLLFVAGKGGTGKSTIAAALALLAARRGRRVLCIEVDARGSLPFALGAEPVGFEPQVVQKGVSALALHPEEALREYLRIYYKLPRFARLTPLARVMDFLATGVPGTKDMLVVGKIAYEEKRMERDRPAWDLIVVDAPATGHVLPQLGAARAMLELARGGIIRSQVEWIDATLTDPRRTALTICALPEEMPVAEAIELHDGARTQTRIAIGACFLNRVFPVAVTSRQLRPLEPAAAAGGRADARGRLGADPALLLDGLRVAARLHDASVVAGRRLRTALTCPVVDVPVQAGARPGLSTTRLVAGAIATATAAA